MLQTYDPAVPSVFQSRGSRSGCRDGSPYRRQVSPEIPPFPGDCEDNIRYRGLSPAPNDGRRSGSQGAGPSAPRDHSQQRFVDLTRSGDYYRRDYERRFREGSPKPDGGHGDFFCRDNTEFGGFSEQRSRAPHVDRDRVRRAASAASRSPKR